MSSSPSSCFFSSIARLLQREQKGSSGDARPCGEEGCQTLDRSFTQLSLFPGAFPDFTDDLVVVKEAGKAVQHVKDGTVRYRHVLKYVLLLVGNLSTDGLLFLQDGY
jgi:hypothetical protein